MKMERRDYLALLRVIGWSSTVILGFTGILYWLISLIAKG